MAAIFKSSRILCDHPSSRCIIVKMRSLTPTAPSSFLSPTRAFGISLTFLPSFSSGVSPALCPLYGSHSATDCFMVSPHTAPTTIGHPVQQPFRHNWRPRNRRRLPPWAFRYRLTLITIAFRAQATSECFSPFSVPSSQLF